MSPLGLVKNFTAQTIIEKRRIVSFGTDDGHVIQSIYATGVLGVSGIRGTASGSRVDIYLTDLQDIECGALVTQGDYVTADAEGRAITAAPAVGVTMQVVGRAMETGPVGSFCKVLIQPQQITG